MMFGSSRRRVARYILQGVGLRHKAPFRTPCLSDLGGGFSSLAGVVAEWLKAPVCQNAPVPFLLHPVLSAPSGSVPSPCHAESGQSCPGWPHRRGAGHHRHHRGRPSGLARGGERASTGWLGFRRDDPEPQHPPRQRPPVLGQDPTVNAAGVRLPERDLPAARLGDSDSRTWVSGPWRSEIPLDSTARSRAAWSPR
jgi:hypothetical protein